MRNFDKEIFNLPTFMFLWSQSLHISQIHWVFCLIFAGIKTKTNQSSLYSTVFFKILKEPVLVQKPTIPHMKALILSYSEPQGWGRGIIIGVPRPPCVKLFATFFSDNKTFKGNFTVMTKDVTVWHFLIALQFSDVWMFWSGPHNNLCYVIFAILIPSSR